MISNLASEENNGGGSWDLIFIYVGIYAIKGTLPTREHVYEDYGTRRTTSDCDIPPL